MRIAACVTSLRTEAYEDAEQDIQTIKMPERGEKYNRPLRIYIEVGFLP